MGYYRSLAYHWYADADLSLGTSVITITWCMGNAHRSTLLTLSAGGQRPKDELVPKQRESLSVMFKSQR